MLLDGCGKSSSQCMEFPELSDSAGIIPCSPQAVKTHCSTPVLMVLGHMPGFDSLLRRADTIAARQPILTMAGDTVVFIIIWDL